MPRPRGADVCRGLQGPARAERGEMSKQDDEIREKLAELEASIEEAPQPLAVTPAGTGVTAPGKKAGDELIESDLFLTIGFGLLLLGVFLVMNHIQVGTGMLGFFGFQQRGFGLTIIPLLIGLGLVFFDYKNRLGWILTAASCALIFFAALSQLVMFFPNISLLGLVIMFLPFAVGGALVARGFNMRRGTGT